MCVFVRHRACGVRAQTLRANHGRAPNPSCPFRPGSHYESFIAVDAGRQCTSECAGALFVRFISENTRKARETEVGLTTLNMLGGC